MPQITNPGCFQCGKSRFKGSQLCPACNDHYGQEKPSHNKPKDSTPIIKMKGQTNVVNCNDCDTIRDCKGLGLIPNSLCKDYRPINRRWHSDVKRNSN